jgi:hypothetical protein
VVSFAIAFKKYPRSYFQNTRPQPHTAASVTCGSAKYPPEPEDDSDAPEQISLPTPKRQIIGRKKDIAKELPLVKSKRMEHDRERDRQPKEQPLKQRKKPIAEEGEASSRVDEEPENLRPLPDHLFAAALNQPPPFLLTIYSQGCISQNSAAEAKRY